MCARRRRLDPPPPCPPRPVLGCSPCVLSPTLSNPSPKGLGSGQARCSVQHLPTPPPWRRPRRSGPSASFQPASTARGRFGLGCGRVLRGIAARLANCRSGSPTMAPAFNCRVRFAPPVRACHAAGIRLSVMLVAQAAVFRSRVGSVRCGHGTRNQTKVHKT